MNSELLFDVKNVSFRYGNILAIDQVTTNITKGKFYGIVGPNGCGKTTFLDLLTGSKIPDQGEISLKGRQLSDFTKRDLAKQLALVPQEYDTGFGYTVEEVVLMGRHPHIARFAAPGKADWQAVDIALESIGITELRDRYTNTLSGGQKQRTVVARALAQNSQVIFFDEATASLDIKYSLQIFNIAKSLVKNEGRTVIAVIHDLNFAAAYCDEIIFMQKGRIAFQGSPDKVLTPDTILEIFGVQCTVEPGSPSNSLQVNYRYGFLESHNS